MSSAWGQYGFGMWAIREVGNNRFVGITGLQHRLDGRGVALRFALWPEAQGSRPWHAKLPGRLCASDMNGRG